MIKIIFVSLIFSLTANAQVKAKVTAKPAPRAVNPSYNAGGYSNSPVAATVLATPTPAAVVVPPPSPWKISYFGEYQGPTLGNLQLDKTQTPGNPEGAAEWDHSFKLGYAVSKVVIVGTQFRAANSTDTDVGFSWADQRFYVQWAHMIETSDIDMSGKFTVELPTTDASRNAGKIFALKFDENFTFKTALRNWMFSADVLLKPYFYNDPVAGGKGKTDFVLGIYPYITLDLVPNVQLLFEGSFDINHNYNAILYDYQPGDPNYFDIGPLITLGSHVNTNLAFRFFTDEISYKATALYFNIEAVL